MNIIKKYLDKIIKEQLTHSEIISIAICIEDYTNIESLKFLCQGLKKHGINLNKRIAIAKFMMEEIDFIEKDPINLPPF